MRLLSFITVGLVWLAITGTGTHTVAQATGQPGCCTALSKAHAVHFIVKRGGAVRCQQQDIKEGCNINAVVLKWNHRQVCVDPTPRKMQNLLKILCSERKAREGVRKPGRLRRRKTKSARTVLKQ